MEKAIVFDEAIKLPSVSAAAANAYAESYDALRTHVDREMINDPATLAHVSHKSLELMYASHGYHARFMANVLKYNSYDLLARIMVWVYRSYHARGFSYPYFSAFFQAWQRAVRIRLSPEHAGEINGVYQWLGKHHPSFVTLAESGAYQTFPVYELTDIRKSFVELLLQGDFHSCTAQAKDFVKTNDDLADFYTEVLQPCLYEIGRLWETGAITVAHEHMAVAIVTRMMAACYLDCKIAPADKGGIVISAAPNEFHDVGARMVADLLELAGWDVDYTGADTPAGELIRLLLEKKPLILGLSAVMAFNLAEVEAIVKAVKSEPTLKGVKIMAGGLAFVHSPELWKTIGADGYVGNIADARELASKWWRERTQK